MADKLAKNFGEPKTYAPEPYEKMYYYAKDKEWEVYADFKGKKYEIGTENISANFLSFSYLGLRFPVSQ